MSDSLNPCITGQPTRLVLALLGAALLLSACSGGDGAAAGSQRRPAISPRSQDPIFVAAREAIEAGDLDLARDLVDQIEPAPGDRIEAMLLAARCAALAGDEVEVSRQIEVARDGAPDDSRIYATAAELHAAFGRLETAQAELQRGVAACGVTSALQRARGVVLICTQGRGQAGLDVLEKAIADDPGIAFIGRPLGQAHMLAGKRCMAEQDPVGAHEHAARSIHFDPEDVDGRRFFAESCIVVGEFGQAVMVYEDLLAEGEPMGGELASLCKNAGLAALLQHDRELAGHYFARARELGLGDVELATGVTVLRDLARASLERARELDAAGDLEGAEQAAEHAALTDVDFLEARLELAAYDLRRGQTAAQAGRVREAAAHLGAALVHDPDSLEGHHFLATALFQLEDFAGAIEHWSWAWETARAEDLGLPEPVHLFLADALERSGRGDEALSILDEYLRTAPDDGFLERTRTARDELRRTLDR
ncbi:MAG: tetratricopeptide (TPR) repeat protein [Chlamydiales bacterium]|jgi:tetratricopeptide (TPR) repeat protein